ncbi:Perchlorate reductase subunit gamma precursor [Gimesia alba]|uniref:Perchlorate reductase subunit gamma n=1 Tax=Gimesia alba TaxID=2527973 RepID=A0A517RDK9_9PLAN|nr:multiheme c-type cytochrome [Gimesia alba]QDT41961.1 Perchlorate reductase subunit gamma precursor [Gimesia alba]
MNDSPTPRNRILLSTIVGICAISIVSVAVVKGLKQDQNLPQTAQEDVAVARPITLIASCDTAGWIVPCGCTSNQSGGLLRRGTYVAAEQQNSKVVLVDVGGAAGGESSYNRTKFEAILQGEIQMGIAAHNLGGSEIKLGADYLQELQKKIEIPFVSANIRDADGKFIAETKRLVDASGTRLLIVGVISPQYAVSGLQISSPRDAVLAIVDQNRDLYDWLIVLAYMPEEELRRFAAELPEADVILGGATHQSIAPGSIGPTTVAAAANQGKFLVQLQPPPGNRQAGWEGRVVEMTEDFSDNEQQKQNLQAFYAELEKRDFTASETGFSPPLPVNPPAGYLIAGTESCLKCHPADCDQWERSAHAHAWKTLTRSGAHVDSDCQRCHTTGFGLPGGFVSRGQSPERIDVGCESCHGPSAAHVQNSANRTPFLARDQCVYCHDQENSPEFNYEEYWKQIIHGQQPAVAASFQQRLETGTEAKP